MASYRHKAIACLRSCWYNRGTYGFFAAFHLIWDVWLPIWRMLKLHFIQGSNPKGDDVLCLFARASRCWDKFTTRGIPKSLWVMRLAIYTMSKCGLHLSESLILLYLSTAPYKCVAMSSENSTCRCPNNIRMYKEDQLHVTLQNVSYCCK